MRQPNENCLYGNNSTILTASSHETGSIHLFSNSSFGNIRALEINNDPYFVGNDVALCLGYQRPNDAINQHVDIDDTVKHRIRSGGQMREMVLINESGVYSLVFGSKLPTAREFKRWVTKDVLPSIRKHGAYMTPEKIEEALINPDMIIRLAQTLKDEKEKNLKLKGELANKQSQVKLLENEIKESAPKVQYVEEVLNSSKTYTSTQMAKELDLRSAEQLHIELRKRNIMFLQSGQWMLTSKYSGKGYTKSRTTPYLRGDGTQGSNTITVWTEKGRQFLHEIFKI